MLYYARRQPRTNNKPKLIKSLQATQVRIIHQLRHTDTFLHHTHARSHTHTILPENKQIMQQIPLPNTTKFFAIDRKNFAINLKIIIDRPNCAQVHLYNWLLTRIHPKLCYVLVTPRLLFLIYFRQTDKFRYCLLNPAFVVNYAMAIKPMPDHKTRTKFWNANARVRYTINMIECAMRRHENVKMVACFTKIL